MQLFAIQNLDFKINNQYNVSLKKKTKIDYLHPNELLYLAKKQCEYFQEK